MSLLRKLLASDAPAAVILVRLMVGAVFLSEGVQKFLFPDDPDRGAARFARIGFAAPEFTAGFVATFEIVCGLLILVGLLTRLAVLPTITIMLLLMASADRQFAELIVAAKAAVNLAMSGFALEVISVRAALASSAPHAGLASAAWAANTAVIR